MDLVLSVLLVLLVVYVLLAAYSVWGTRRD